MPWLTTALWGCLAAVVIGTVAGCTSEAAPPPPEVPKVSVMHPEARELTDVEEFNGWMAPDQLVEVRSRVRGHIQNVGFVDGQTVKEGDLLFELDPRPFQTAVGQAEDTLKIYEAQKIAAEKDFERLKNLLEKGGASVQQVDKAEADVASLAAQISATQNEIARAQLDLEYARITADIGGRISKAELTEGNLVNAGGSDPLLTTIVSTDPIRIYFNVDERSLLRYGKLAGAAGRNLTELLSNLKDSEADFTFALDGETEFAHRGKLRFGDNRIDPSTGTIQVYGIVPNGSGAFVPGARVRVRLPIGKPYAALLVPDTAILADQDKRYVLIVDDEKVVRRRDVSLGTLTDDGLRVIIPPSSSTEREAAKDWWVITDNLQRARLNYPVDPQLPAASATTPS